MAKAYEMKNVPSANSVWGAVLRDHGFSREILPNTCPQCYTLEQYLNPVPIPAYQVANPNCCNTNFGCGFGA